VVEVTGDRPVRVSGSIELDLTRTAQKLAGLVIAEIDVPRTADRIADLVVAKLAERGLVVSLPETGERGEPYNPAIDHHAPPTFGEVTE
jgi:hypothetical protein